MIYPRKGLTACSHRGEMYFYITVIHVTGSAEMGLYTLYVMIQAPYRFPHTNPTEGLPSPVGEGMFLSANVCLPQLK